MLKCNLIFDLTLLILVWPGIALSANSNSKICSASLFDSKIIQQSAASFNPKDLWIYQSEIAPILDGIHNRLPGFAAALNKALNKKWRFVNEDINSCPLQWAFTPSLNQNVACQTPANGNPPNEVRINAQWFENLSAASCQPLKATEVIQSLRERQKDFFLHQLLLGITQGTKISADSSEQIYELLSMKPMADAKTMQLILESSGFGIYGTQDPSCGQDSSPRTLSDQAKQNVDDNTQAASQLAADLSDQSNNHCEETLNLGLQACATPSKTCENAIQLAKENCGGSDASFSQSRSLPACGIDISPYSCFRGLNKYFLGWVNGLCHDPSGCSQEQQNAINACHNSTREATRKCLENYAKIRCSSITYVIDPLYEKYPWCEGNADYTPAKRLRQIWEALKTSGQVSF